MDKESELKYLAELGKGNHEAFNILFMSYHSLVKRFLLGFIKDDDEVSDIAQDVFYNVWTHREFVSKAGSFKAYLFRMVRNAIYNHYKLNVIRQGHLQKFYQQQILVDDLLEEKLHAEELGLLIDIAIDNMPPQRKRIFTMSRKDGLTNEEIAQQLNINKRTVENHITQALADLRKILKVMLPFFI
ncbi:MAG: RNA polymerase sigma-70 factor [Dysgonamonadaceae bacterium]|jgi:RNA polymerase sigma-70 factor (ECF subfamily)|nr:RNA polymerase sigma-70 factor [Dysgonamonadaceae bacterium]